MSTKKIERPKVVSGTTYMVDSGCGKLFATINNHAGKPFEMFLKLGSQGSCPSAFMAALGTILSVSLRSGAPMGAFVKVLSASTCPAAHREVIDIVNTEDGIEEVYTETFSCMAGLGRLLGEITEHASINPSSGPLSGILEDTTTGCGCASIGCFKSNGKLARVSIELGAAGSCAAAISSTLAKCVNIALACGVDPQDVARSLAGIHCPKSNHSSASCLDAIGQIVGQSSTN